MSKDLVKMCNKSTSQCINLAKQLKEAQDRIDKAIEYIKSHRKVFVLGINKEVDEFDYISTSPKELLKILKGE